MKIQKKNQAPEKAQTVHSQTSSAMFFWTSDSEAKGMAIFYHGSFNLSYAKAVQTVIFFFFSESGVCILPVLNKKFKIEHWTKDQVFFDL